VAGGQGNSGQAADALKAWRRVHASSDIQFAPLPPAPKPSPPSPFWRWLDDLLRAIFEPVGRALGLSWPVIQYVLMVAAAVLALFVLWRLLARLFRARSAKSDAPDPEWAPDPATARALLADADRLAEQGAFGEAVHLLLRRSVDEIAAARPEWLRPASTAREIALLQPLPDRARGAFAVLARAVERSHFALLGLTRADWDTARAAYADFALAELAR
jgi:hypothetical protein